MNPNAREGLEIPLINIVSFLILIRILKSMHLKNIQVFKLIHQQNISRTEEHY